MPRATSKDLFTTQAIPVGDDRQRRAHMVIHCAACPAFEAVQSTSRGGAVSAPLATRKFTELGWDVGRRPGQHLCPDCRPQRRAEKPERPVLTLVEKEEPVTRQSTSLARELTFADRRIINTKLEEVYENELLGYREGWNDEAVANDLGVETRWVSELRAANFGPSAGNSVMAELRAEQKALADRMEHFRAEGEKLANAIKALSERMTAVGLGQAA